MIVFQIWKLKTDEKITMGNISSFISPFNKIATLYFNPSNFILHCESLTDEDFESSSNKVC